MPLRKGWKLVAKRKETTKTGVVARVAAVGCASLLAVGCLGFSIGFAGSGAAADQSFGLTKANAEPSAQQSFAAADSEDSSFGNHLEFDSVSLAHEQSVLTSVTTRDISRGVEDIEAEREAARIAAEKLAEEQRQANMAKAQAAAGLTSSQGLSLVDWSVGKEAFIAEWTKRIDAYLVGFPLEGYGVYFATAAWEYGVDPRWSPAISNTESTRGTNCFRYCNAWGWGKSGWPNWETAIDAHVYGLSQGYGHTISLANAQKYCPPTYESWYANTLSFMKEI